MSSCSTSTARSASSQGIPPDLTGTFINVGAILAGTLVGVLLGGRLPGGLQRRVLAALGLVALVIGGDRALAWRATSPPDVPGGGRSGGPAGAAPAVPG